MSQPREEDSGPLPGQTADVPLLLVTDATTEHAGHLFSHEMEA